MLSFTIANYFYCSSSSLISLVRISLSRTVRYFDDDYTQRLSFGNVGDLTVLENVMELQDGVVDGDGDLPYLLTNEILEVAILYLHI